MESVLAHASSLLVGQVSWFDEVGYVTAQNTVLSPFFFEGLLGSTRWTGPHKPYLSIGQQVYPLNESML